MIGYYQSKALVTSIPSSDDFIDAQELGHIFYKNYENADGLYGDDIDQMNRVKDNSREYLEDTNAVKSNEHTQIKRLYSLYSLAYLNIVIHFIYATFLMVV